MKRITKGLSVGLALALSVSLAACSGSSDAPTEAQTSTAAETKAETKPETEPATEAASESSVDEAAENTASKFNAGTYVATVDSVGGPLTVSVTVSDDRIEAVEVTEIHDTEGIYNPVVQRLPGLVVENQSVNVDAVAGATLSSMFFKNALNQALLQAADNLDDFQEKITYQASAQTDMEADVVIVGAGMSGLSAALTTASQGYSTILLEELAYVGGNAIPSDQYSIGSGEKWDDVLKLFNDNGTDLKFVDFAGGPMQRMLPANETHTSWMNEICSQLKAVAEEKGAVVLTETPAIDLIIEDGEVKGVVARPVNQDEFRITARAVLLACGGFQGNKEMVDQYLPYASGAMTIGPSKGTGSVYTWLDGMNVATRDMDWELAMFYSVNPSTGHHAVWGNYNMNFLDENGDLITDDHNYNSGSMKTYMAVGNGSFYTLWSQTDVDNANDDPAIMEEFIRSKSVEVFTSISSIADAYNMPNLVATLTELGYGEDDTYYVAVAKSGIYGTMGGIAVDEQFRVVDTDGNAIPGLFAAGETLGRNYGGAVGVATISGYDAAFGIDAVLSGEAE